MGIKDLKPGPKLETQIGGLHRYCYSHLLPAAVQGRYDLYAQHSEEFSVLYVRIFGDGDRFGYLDAGLHGNAIDISDVWLNEKLRRKGVGTAMYEAAIAHGMAFLGVKRMMGGDHSTMAHRVHKAIIKKHGLPGYGYRPHDNSPSYKVRTQEYDGAYGPYTYSLVA